MSQSTTKSKPGGTEGWDDWGDDGMSAKPQSTKTTSKQMSQKSTSGGNAGWDDSGWGNDGDGWGNDEWGSMDDAPKSGNRVCLIMYSLSHCHILTNTVPKSIWISSTRLLKVIGDPCWRRTL